jgi:hypothetical protein
MTKILLTFFLIMSLFIACNNKTGNQEPQATATARTQIDTSLGWVEYRLGELTDPRSNEAMDTLVKKYKLRYYRFEAGCVIGEEEEMLKAKYDHQNQRYFREMEKIHGKH